jgi:hypothetical protein
LVEDQSSTWRDGTLRRRGQLVGALGTRASIECAAVDRRLAAKNLRTGLIAAAISLLVLAAAFLAAWVY